MAAKTIKGITVEINGDARGLGDVLKDVDKQAVTASNSLKQLNKLLKLDPTNTQLLAEKQKVLAEAVNAAKEKLKDLEAVQDQIARQYAAGDIDRGAYLDFQNEILQTRKRLEDLEEQQKKFGSTVKQTMEEAGRKISEVGDKVSSFGNKVSGAGEKLMPVTGAIVAAGAAAVKFGSDLEESQNKVEVAFHDSADVVKEFAQTTLDTYGIAEGTALDMAALFGDMGTSMGLLPAAAAEMSTSLVGLAGDLASFKNIGLEEAQSALKGVFTGETESLKNLGIVMTQTNLEAFALANGINKTWKEMTEAEKVQLRYAYVMNATQNAQGDFARTSDGAANSMRVCQEAVKEVAASFGTLLTPYVAEAASMVADFLKGLAAMPEEQKRTVLAIAGIVAAVGPLLITVGKVATGVGSIISLYGKVTTAMAGVTTGTGALGAAFSFLAANPVVLTIAAITAFVAVLIGAYNNVEWFRDGVNACMDKVKEVTTATMQACNEVTKERLADMKAAYEENGGGIRGIVAATMSAIEGMYTDGWKVIDKLTGGKLTAIRETILENMNAARDGVKKAIDKMKSFFNFTWSLPKIKLPHFSITGAFSLIPPSVPKINVSWYARGAILTAPTIFGALGSTLLGGGEAGREAILPLDNNTGWMRDLALELASYLTVGGTMDIGALLGKLDGIYDRLGRLQIVLDNGTLVGESIDLIDAALADKQLLSERGV